MKQRSENTKKGRIAIHKPKTGERRGDKKSVVAERGCRRRSNGRTRKTRLTKAIFDRQNIEMIKLGILIFELSVGKFEKVSF